jgi:hypothetical protein
MAAKSKQEGKTRRDMNKPWHPDEEEEDDATSHLHGQSGRRSTTRHLQPHLSPSPPQHTEKGAAASTPSPDAGRS